MSASTAIAAAPSCGVTMGRLDLLPHQVVFRARDLEQVREHNGGVFVDHGLAYLPRERHVDFCHRQAMLGSITVNLLEYGAGVMVTAPSFADFYVLQFTIAGECRIWQERRHCVLPTESVAVMNPFWPFKKAWLPGARQLMLRIDKRMVDREFRAWTGTDDAGRIEFDSLPIDNMAKVGTLTRYVQMLCDDLRNKASDLSRPLIADRVASGLVSLLLASMPHNKTRAIEAAGQATASPFFVRRVEQFIEEHARDAIVLADLTSVAGVSTRALQAGFRRFRDTTPMAYLRAIRLELARADLAKAGRLGSSVAAVAHAFGFAHLGRFARDYQARFGELPSQTLYRGSIGRAH